MGRSKYEAKRTYPSRRNNTNQPRPKTPPWLRRTVFGRNRSKFLIGGGIILTILLILGIAVGIVQLNRSNEKPENIDIHPPKKQEEFSTKSPRSKEIQLMECENSEELAREWNGTDIILENEYRERFKKIIEKRVGKDENETIKEMKSFYQFCMDEGLTEEYAVQSLKGVIKNLGGWPLMNITGDNSTCHTEPFCLQSEVENLRKKFISACVVPCPSTRTYCIQLVLDFKMESEEQCAQVNHQQNEALRTNMKNLTVIFGADISDELVFERDCLMLLSPMRNLCRFSSKQGMEENLPITIEEFEEQTKYEGKLIRNTIPESRGMTNLKVWYPLHTGDILYLTSQMDAEQIVNIAMWEFVSRLKFYLPKNFRKNLLDPITFKTLEQVEESDRSGGCVDEILSAYPSTSRKMYRMEYYDSEIQENVERILKDAKEGFTRISAEMSWVDNRTINKLRAISLYTPKSQKDILGPLTINETDPIKTILNLTNLKLIRNYSYLNESFDLEDEEYAQIDKSDPAPRYMRESNDLYVPVETLHMYFRKGRPDYMNYVTLGFMFTRQIALGFHLQWLGEDKQYSKRMNCFINQFLNRPTNHTEDQDKGETWNKLIVTYMGLRAAYAAYDVSIKRNGNSQSNNAAYNNRQMFWLTVGNLLSKKNSIESKLIPYLDEFHRDFDCQTRLIKACSLE